MMGFMDLEAEAGATAPAPECADVATPTAKPYRDPSDGANPKRQPRYRRTRGEPTERARGPFGDFTVTGQTARGLVALVRAGKHGITALEMSSWAYRLGAYIHRLRHENGIAIETVREDHDGGWHARYVLRCPVTILEAGQ